MGSLKSIIREHRWAGIILAAVLILRLAAFLAVYAGGETDRFAEPDTGGYERSALALAENGRFTLSPESKEPMLKRTPGYPVYLAAVYLVFGYGRFWPVFFQIILSGLIVLLVYRIAEPMGSRRAALAAAVFAAIDSIQFYYSQIVLTETFFSLFITLGLFFALRFYLEDTRKPLMCGFFGLCLAAATLIRPVSYYLPVPIALGVVFTYRAAGLSARELVSSLLLFFLPLLLFVGGWQLRNTAAADLHHISSITGINMYNYRAAEITARRESISFDEARDLLRSRLPEQFEQWSAGAQNEYLLDEAGRIIGGHKGTYGKIMLLGVVRMLADPGDSAVVRYLTGDTGYTGRFGDLFCLSPADYFEKWIRGAPLRFFYFAAALLLLAILYLAALYGSIASWPRSPRLRIFFALLIGTGLYFLLVSAGPESYARFRMSFSSILYIFAGIGVSRLLDKRGSRKGK